MTPRHEHATGRARRETPLLTFTTRALLVASTLSLSIASANAQTVMLRNGPPGGTIEVSFNGAPAGTATASANGHATIELGGAARINGEVDAFVFVDQCGNRRHVVIVRRALEPPAPAGNCLRQEIPGVFVLRPVSTLVIDVAGASPTMLLRQGPHDPDKPPKTWDSAPEGLIAHGGAGFAFGDIGDLACGNVAECSPDGTTLGLTGGVAYWLTPVIGAEFSYVRPGKMTAQGVGTRFTFDSTQDTDVYTFSGVLGIPAGPARIFGKGGANYHLATFSTTQTIEPASVTVDGVTTTIPGGTTTVAVRTSGWGWLIGGGVEVWVGPRLGLYGEFTYNSLKGEDVDDGEAVMEDRLTTILFGAKLRIF